MEKKIAHDNTVRRNTIREQLKQLLSHPTTLHLFDINIKVLWTASIQLLCKRKHYDVDALLYHSVSIKVIHMYKMPACSF